jgi:hypothetical protein
MAKSGCAACSFRARYDNNPKAFLGRLWKWHTNFCPGWKSYMTSLPDQERLELAEKYNMPKFR